MSDCGLQPAPSAEGSRLLPHLEADDVDVSAGLEDCDFFPKLCDRHLPQVAASLLSETNTVELGQQN